MNNWILYLLPFFSALVGWVLAKVAVAVYVQTILKKRKTLSVAIGNYAEQQFSFDTIEQKLTDPAAVETILPFAEGHIDTFLRVKLPAAMPMLAMFISDKLVADMKGIFMTELKTLIPALIQQYLTNVKKGIRISTLISSKLDSISAETISPVLQKPLQVVTYACVATGFCCGCLYILLTLLA